MPVAKSDVRACTVSSFIIKIYKCGRIKFSYSDAANPVFIQFWRTNPKGAQPAKASAAAGDAANAAALQLAKQRARAITVMYMHISLMNPPCNLSWLHKFKL